jgi:hypothetical protein
MNEVLVRYLNSTGASLGTTSFFYHNWDGIADPGACGSTTEEWVNLADTDWQSYSYTLDGVKPASVDWDNVTKLSVEATSYMCSAPRDHWLRADNIALV